MHVSTHSETSLFRTAPFRMNARHTKIQLTRQGHREDHFVNVDGPLQYLPGTRCPDYRGFTVRAIVEVVTSDPLLQTPRSV